MHLGKLKSIGEKYVSNASENILALDLKFPIQAIEKERKKWPLRNGLKLKNSSKEHLFWFLDHLVTHKKKSM